MFTVEAFNIKKPWISSILSSLLLKVTRVNELIRAGLKDFVHYIVKVYMSYFSLLSWLCVAK